MSLEISLRKKGEGGVIMSLNWLRNPFGLEQWAESNTEIENTEIENTEHERLRYVCNHWNYDKAKEIDKKLFKEVVDKYWAIIREVEVGRFVFDLPEYRQFVEGPIGKKLKYGDYKYRNGHTEIAIKMELFKDVLSLDGYKEWFLKLVVFAEKLQEEDIEFYCSN